MPVLRPAAAAAANVEVYRRRRPDPKTFVECDHGACLRGLATSLLVGARRAGAAPGQGA